MAETWQFWIDVGGTFTDCLGVTPDGELRQCKTLSSGITKGTIQQSSNHTISDSLRCGDPDSFWVGANCRLLNADGEVVASTTVAEFAAAAGTLSLKEEVDLSQAVSYELNPGLPAPVIAIRWLQRLNPDAVCAPARIRFGTTRGTNALLTRTGARTVLITTKGFTDAPIIGNQDRPDLFALNIRKPETLFSRVMEVDERIDANGNVLRPLNAVEEKSRLAANGITPSNFDSVAICLMHAYRNPIHEQQIQTVCREAGFTDVSRSSEVSPLIRFVPRCDTTVLDAYLNPVLREYLTEISDCLPGSQIQVMTSAGGLVDSRGFRGRDCILSGPAGGIVGFAKVAEAEGFKNAIGFDMGGTSTDVARFSGRFELENETTKAGVRIMSPVLAIETVAAGGGSICGFNGTRLFVGPQSAGANPGPACYGNGGPLTVTDLNVFLGRILPEHFPFPLNTAAIKQRLDDLCNEMAEAGVATQPTTMQQLAEGLLNIANDNMAQAIRKVSVAKGYDPGDHVLVSFGGAGGQHACSIARSLKIRTVLIHPFAGILSAFGMGQADVRAIRQSSVLKPLNDQTLQEVAEIRQRLVKETTAEVLAQNITEDNLSQSSLSLEMRYLGTDSSLMIAEQPGRSFHDAFEAEHERLFGYRRSGKAVEVASLRVETVGRAAQPETIFDSNQDQAEQTTDTELWFAGRKWQANVATRSSLKAGDQIRGPAIICEPTSTIFVEPNCEALVTDTGTIRIDIGSTEQPECDSIYEVDPVQLEIFNNQFVSIAEQMGETLRRTATSTNVRERLDFSCALFDQNGNLVVNAPHVPVHLGAMGETVRAIMSDHSTMSLGDVFVTNDPYRGGSHLPDVTVVSPVFVEPNSTTPAFFVANRAHHAEIGGIVPGSMPPFSRKLAEEGVLITSQKLVDAGVSREADLKALLEGGPFPSRAIADNLADLAAQAAANECGARLLRELARQHSTKTVQSYMRHIQSTAAQMMRSCLQRLDDRNYAFEDKLDDGTVICVTISVSGETATVDFKGTAGVHAGNLNANRAITTSAVLYCFRCLLNEDVPLNAGVLEPVEIIIPEGLLNPPRGATPENSPAIVGGNVETSQRIVDVLLGALELAAASQGTMNNLTFGDETFGYYETICGGAGATPTADGADAVHTHMTNTRLTDPEVLEQRYPVRLRQFSIRKGSGGAGRFRGGDGIVRELEFLKPLHVSILSQRREPNRPYGINDGEPGQPGVNVIDDRGIVETAGGSFTIEVTSGTVLTIASPGGGGWGKDATAQDASLQS